MLQLGVPDSDLGPNPLKHGTEVAVLDRMMAYQEKVSPRRSGASRSEGTQAEQSAPTIHPALRAVSGHLATGAARSHTLPGLAKQGY